VATGSFTSHVSRLTSYGSRDPNLREMLSRMTWLDVLLYLL